MLRRCSAAAPQQPGAFFCKGGKLIGEGRHADIIHDFAVFHLGKAGVGLDDHRKVAKSEQLIHKGAQFHRPHAAVKAQSVHPQATKKGENAGRVPARQQLAPAVRRDGGENRQPRFLRGEHRGLEFIKIAHGFDENQVRPGPGPRVAEGGKGGNSVQKIKIPKGAQQLARRPHVQRGKERPSPGVGTNRGLLCVFHGRGDDALKGIERSAVLDPV